jgi:outer membrane immunogenic protein
MMRSIIAIAFGLTALATSAMAADMPVKAPPPPAPVMYSWTGFYIGGHVGGAWRDLDGRHRFDNFCVGAVCFADRDHGDSDGSFIAGGQVGFNYQVGQWVWGVEGQASWVDHDNDRPCGFFTFGAVQDHLFRCRDGGDWIATIAARLGVTFGQTGNWLLYVKGGAAFADSGFDIRRRPDCVFAFCTVNFTFNDNDDTRTGWMVGAGVEYGAWSNWSWKLEYNFMDFGDRHHRFATDFTAFCAGCVLNHGFDFDHQIHVVKLGLNYRFGGGAPVTARY